MPHHKFGRRPPRLDRLFQRFDFPVWFVTFNTMARTPWLACAPVHEAFIRFAHRAHQEHGISVGRYVLMPDHAHLFVTGCDVPLGKWVGMLKLMLAKARPDRKCGGTDWQEGFFDHLLRNSESYAQKWDYVRNNPVRAGLIGRWEQWPWQGKIIPIDRV
jgi:REP element-mobilizing transposase RayT